MANKNKERSAYTKKLPVPSVLRKMNKIFTGAGYEAYLVGGAVRDMLLGKNANDWDIATNASPREISRLFRHVIPTGIAHGTVTVIFENKHIEVTTYRTESAYSDGRHPDSVSYAATIQEDLSRRDFTINALAVSMTDGRVIDPYGGQNDIRSKTIRTVGSALERFGEDGLRPIRALRFSAQLGFEIDRQTLDAIPACSDKIRGISIERFRDEFSKLLSAKTPSAALKLMEHSGILDIFLPELSVCRNVMQADFRGHHQFDVLDHLFYACDGAVPKLHIRLAALFHDIGKPLCKKTQTRQAPDGTVQPINTFFGHENVSSKLAKQILIRLRYPNKVVTDVCHLVSQHMFHYEPDWSDAAVRRFIARVGTEYIEDLYDLRIADVYGMAAAPPLLTEGPWVNNLLELKGRIAQILSQNAALSLKDLAINGRDLILEGIPAGKALGHILNELLNAVIEDPGQNTRERLILIAKNSWMRMQQESAICPD